MTGPLVVLDTNVVVSALIATSGTLATLRDAWARGLVVPLASTPTIEELIAVLAYAKLRLSREDQAELLGDYLPYCKVVPVAGEVAGIPVCRDPWDRPFLELAQAAAAEYLVTGDRDLLTLGDQPTYRIVTPRALVERVGLPG